MLSWDTIKMIGCLNKLAAQTAHGFRPLSSFSYEEYKQYPGIVYDDASPRYRDEGVTMWSVVADWIDGELILTYGEILTGLYVEYIEERNENDELIDSYVSVDMDEEEGMIVVNDGKWYTEFWDDTKKERESCRSK